ncbi:spindle pole body component alp6 [Phyllosticta citriasiana]|uniref:Spindle pole body component alp6 n=1 Tax=Phyllosticta citriasiana TaxID=595635 RepID=A0ABR1KLJ4_9PEZI
MPQTTEERVEHALSKLLEYLLPQYPHEDEDAADQRLDDAFNYALDAIGSSGEPSIASDVNHAADLIKKKLVRESSSPEKPLHFANLYSRLLTQPVLNQKWAMLYFLYRLSDSDMPAALQDLRSPPRSPVRNEAAYQSLTAPENPLSPTRFARERQLAENPMFNEAFANEGLQRLPPAEEPKPARASTERTKPSEKQKGHERSKTASIDRKRTSLQKKEEEAAAEKGGEKKYTSLTSYEPSETALLRDLPFTLQGLSSSNLAFAAPSTLKIPATLPAPLVSLLHTLAEPSLLYRNLSEFVDSSEGGLVGQSLRSALGIELRAYLGLVATLEGQIRRALSMLDDSQPRQGIGKAGVTLKRCVIWTREATMGLRLMSLIIEESKGKKGGELISLIHSFSLSHGDPFVGAFAERLLAHVTRPFYDMLRQWIYDGELSDPYQEFFVSEQYEDANDENAGKGAATSVWEDKYKLNDKMTPTIVSPEFANKVFLIGKTLNFIRYGCGDAAWVESYSKDASRELRYGDTAALERNIGEAYKTTMARLIHLMANKFKLFEHLRALKKYILLGAGDFIAVLMESLSSNLDQPANTQYRHTLTAQLEHAVRNSNAQYDSPEVLRRLDSRMLELSHGEIGWDVFTLEYKIDAPVDVIVTPMGSKQYLKMFNFLWRVKRVEFALGSTWRRCMTAARQFLGAVEDRLGSDWKKARCTVAEMIHFVNQLQYYILFEVIESSWNELQERMRRPEATLDDLIQAHAQYLTNITRKGLLNSSDRMDFTGQLHELLKIMLRYKDAVDGLYSFSTAEFARRQERAAKIETRTAAGKWGLSDRDSGAFDSPVTRSRSATNSDGDGFPPPLLPNAPHAGGGAEDDDILVGLRNRLGLLGRDFKVKVNLLLGDLLHQPDADMRWLAMVMNFNDSYAPVRRKKTVSGGAGSGAGASTGRRSRGEALERGGSRREETRA